MCSYHWKLLCYNMEQALQVGTSLPTFVSVPLPLRTAVHWGCHYAGLVFLNTNIGKDVDFQVLLRNLDTLSTGTLSPATSAPATTAPATALPSIRHQEDMSAP